MLFKIISNIISSFIVKLDLIIETKKQTYFFQLYVTQWEKRLEISE